MKKVLLAIVVVVVATTVGMCMRVAHAGGILDSSQSNPASSGGSSGTVGSGTTGQVPYYASNGTTLTAATPGGDCSFSTPSNFVCTKTNGTNFGPLATQSTSGSSVLKGNGAGGVANAVAGTDYQAPIAGNTLASHNFANSINTAGTIAGAQPAFTDLSGSVAASQMPALTGDATSVAGALATTVGVLHLTTKTIGTGAVTSYNVVASDSFLLVNNTVTSGVLTINLLSVASDVNHTICFKRIDTNTFPVEILPNGTDTIEGQSHGMWMGGGTVSNGSHLIQVAATGMARCITNNGGTDWKVIAKDNATLGADQYVRCIPGGNQSLTAGTNTQVCSSPMPSLPFDPGPGCAYISWDEGGIVTQYTAGSQPTALLSTLFENASGTNHSDGHGWNPAAFIQTATGDSKTNPSVWLPGPGLVDTASSSTDIYAPWQTWNAQSQDQCTGSGTPFACCTGSGTGTCKGGSTVGVDVESFTNGATTLNGAGVSGNGADSAVLIRLHLKCDLL